jgi:integrase
VPNQTLAKLSPPDATEVLVGSVLATLSSDKTKQAYETALTDFLSWTTERAEPLSKPLVEAWRAALLERGLSVSCINQRLSAVRLLFRQAAERGALTAEEALRLSSVSNVKQSGQRLGKWLTEAEAGKLLGVPAGHTCLGIRDRSILALLVACGLRRDELVRLEVRHLQLRDERWVLLDIQGKGRRIRTVPVPLWVKRLLDRWLTESGITEGPLFRTLRKGGALEPTVQSISEDLIYTLVRRAGAAIGHPELTPHDLRRTCAKLCRKAGGDLEQIQLLLGHASIQTTERYLGTKQDLVQAVNDRVKIRVE